MANERGLTLDRLYSTIEEILSSSMKYSDVCHRVEPVVAIWGEQPQRSAVSDTTGCRRPIEIAHFLQQLHSNNVWPRKCDLWQGKIIEGIFNALEQLQVIQSLLPPEWCAKTEIQSELPLHTH